MQYDKILMIDDDPDDRTFFLETLEELDPTIKCSTANNGIYALDLLKDEQRELPDMIFLDLNMPIMNGKQCLQKLKSNERLSSIPVVIYSTSKEPDEIEETERLGASHFLKKPNSVADLKKELEDILSKDWTEKLHGG